MDFDIFDAHADHLLVIDCARMMLLALIGLCAKNMPTRLMAFIRE